MKFSKLMARLTQSAVVVLTPLIIVASTAVVYYAHKLLMSPPALEALKGPSEVYGKPTRLLQIAILNAQQNLLLFRNKPGRESIANAQRTFRALNDALVSVPHPATNVPQHPLGAPDLATLDTIRDLVSRANGAAGGLGRSPGSADSAYDYLDSTRPAIDKLLNDISNANAEYRNIVREDFIAERHDLFLASVALILLVATALAIAIYQITRRQGVIRRQLSELHVEHAANLAARKSIAAKNAFLGTVGHELRTPLQSITSAIDLITSSEVALRHQAPVIRLETAVAQLESQLRDLTDFARLEDGRIQLHPKNFSPHDLVNSAVDDAAIFARKKLLTISFDGPGPSARANADPIRIRQIVNNLINNAIKYTERGHITVKASLSENDQVHLLTVSVADTGPGIPADKLDTVFEPFTQLDTSNTRQYDGVGMGLAIVRGLLTVLAGTISIKSTVGQGSEFTINIPVKRPNPDEQVFDFKEIGDLDDNGDYCILVVDDKEDVRESIHALLMDLRYDCDLCGTADRAIQKLMRRPFAAVLLDFQMPGRDGISVAKEIRSSHGPNRNIPIIGISAYPQDRIGPGSEIFDNYLMKPVRLADLKLALQKAAISNS